MNTSPLSDSNYSGRVRRNIAFCTSTPQQERKDRSVLKRFQLKEELEEKRQFRERSDRKHFHTSTPKFNMKRKERSSRRSLHFLPKCPGEKNDTRDVEVTRFEDEFEEEFEEKWRLGEGSHSKPVCTSSLHSIQQRRDRSVPNSPTSAICASDSDQTSGHIPLKRRKLVFSKYSVKEGNFSPDNSQDSSDNSSLEECPSEKEVSKDVKVTLFKDDLEEKWKLEEGSHSNRMDRSVPKSPTGQLCVSRRVRPKTNKLFTPKSSVKEANTSPYHYQDSSDDSSLEECHGEEEDSKDVEVTRYEDEFEEERQLGMGQGNHSKVMLASKAGELYAVKVAKKAKNKSILKAEVFALTKVKRARIEGVVKCFDYWVESDNMYIQTEWCNGGSLADDLANRRKGIKKGMTEEELVELARQVAASLASLHKERLVHLDIKPENIFMKISHDDEVSYILGDLGHATQISEKTKDVNAGDCRYVAPEIMNLRHDFLSVLDKADIFSLGITLFEAASLTVIPKNSDQVIPGSPSYEGLQKGELPRLQSYSDKFHKMLLACVNPVVEARPGAAELVNSAFVLGEELPMEMG